MPERARQLNLVAMEMLKDYPGHPEGTIAAVPSVEFNPETGDEIGLLGQAKMFEEKGIARRLEAPALATAEGAAGESKTILCVDKIMVSPALYPGDVAGFAPEQAEKLIKSGAAHIATADDLKRFYDPYRDLGPEKQQRKQQTPALTQQAAGMRLTNPPRRGKTPAPQQEE